ncbi:MAG TPA: hypothetical protein VG013_42240 [Gemmataceae bacterium]|nr:hypothetical protein [Gemmataceae bacterium]
MKAFACDRLARSFGGVLATLLAGVLLAPSVARASCGDYLVRGMHPASGAMSANARGAVAGMPSAAHHAGPTDHGQNTPCSGPNCSRGRPPQAPPQAPPAPVRGDRDVCTTAWRASDDPDAVVPLLDGGARKPLRRGQVIYHPPRSSHSGIWA